MNDGSRHCHCVNQRVSLPCSRCRTLMWLTLQGIRRQIALHHVLIFPPGPRPTGAFQKAATVKLSDGVSAHVFCTQPGAPPSALRLHQDCMLRNESVSRLSGVDHGNAWIYPAIPANPSRQKLDRCSRTPRHNSINMRLSTYQRIGALRCSQHAHALVLAVQTPRMQWALRWTLQRL